MSKKTSTRKQRSWLSRFAGGLASLALFGIVVAVIGGAFGLWLMSRYADDLPDYAHLAQYEPPTVTRVHAGNGQLLAEYAKERRVFVPIEAIPLRIKQAFLSAEDKSFYSHPGVDFRGIARAVIDNIQRLRDNRRPVGASTITQQVAKNFLLTNEVSIDRKIKEALLAFRIEQAFTKDQILELYLNQIFLGYRSHGVAAAALNYFNKSLDELTLAEIAFIAGLPKAPSSYDPAKNMEAALGRRSYVIRRMVEDGYIGQIDADEANAEPIAVQRRDATEITRADFFTEEVRRILVQQFGEEGFYEGGWSVRTTVDPSLQVIADKALRKGLSAYDRRQGWRGPLTNIGAEGLEDWPAAIEEFDPGFDLMNWQTAIVVESGGSAAQIGFAGGGTGQIVLGDVGWARWLDADGNQGAEVSRVDQILAAGDVILVEEIEPEEGREGPRYGLRQIPQIDGAVVAMNPHTGRVLAMSGGFSFQMGQFNRATQAKRQPGSAFKPFVYLAALEQGWTPADIVLDAPIVIDRSDGSGKWKPTNYGDRFYGPSTLRLGIEKSRNLMTVRLAQEIGMRPIVDLAARAGVAGRAEFNLSTALGANEIDLTTLTAGYAMIVNGGKKITPSLIERIQDRHGQTLIRRDERQCTDCLIGQWRTDLTPPQLPDFRDQIIDARHAYQMTAMLKGVVERGTGARALSIGKPLAGKTGTTNESRDTWYVGFAPDLALGVYVGFDTPKPLGDGETGSSVALPIWVDVMSGALADQPSTPFRTPPGISLVRVDAKTGLLPGPSTETIIAEAFIPGTEPLESSPRNNAATANSASTGGTATASPGTVSSGGSDPAPSAGGLY